MHVSCVVMCESHSASTVRHWIQVAQNQRRDATRRLQTELVEKHLKIPYCNFIQRIQTDEECRIYRLQQWYSLYNTNRDELKRLESGITSHPFHKHAIPQFVAQHKEKTTRDIDYIELILTHTSHVSWDEFYTRLKRIANEAVEYIKNNTQYKHVVLLLPDLKYKSNFWITLLVTPLIWSVVTDVAEFVTGSTANIVASGGNVFARSSNTIDSTWITSSSDDTIYISCDDCIFTGKQLLGSIRCHLSSSSKCIVLCPYISKQSGFCGDQDNDYYHHEYIYMKSTEWFQNLKQQLKTENETLYQKWAVEKKALLWKHTLLFDHKLADYESIYTIWYQGLIEKDDQDKIWQMIFPLKLPPVQAVYKTANWLLIGSRQTPHSWLLQQQCQQFGGELHHFHVNLLSTRKKPQKRTSVDTNTTSKKRHKSSQHE